MNDWIEIRKLSTPDSQSVVQLLKRATSEDRNVFHPFPFTQDAVSSRLASCYRDIFFGSMIRNLQNIDSIGGFYMLRGLDEGFEAPMFGVFVDPSYRGQGLGHLLIQHAIAMSRFRRYPKILLKVHSGNQTAMHLYRRIGFIQVGVKDEQILMEYLFTRP